MAQVIRYAGAEYLIADATANALLEYSARLSRRATVEVVDVPMRRADGSRGVVRLIIGAAMPLASETSPDGRGVDADLEQRRAAERLRERAADIGHGGVTAPHPDGDGSRAGAHRFDSLDDL
ncbi:hypothetical protein ACFQ58_04285 [Agromyces sp. NPDC056523]|uniref:hypothetical protein n=1 Tax=Agromyces sp. NPDC056523 TaxID=3345850 RepID=UPI0036706A23